MIDKQIFKSRYLDIWFNTFEIGISINYARQLNTFFIHLIVFEIAIILGEAKIC